MLRVLLIFLPALQAPAARVEVTIDLKPGASFEMLVAGPSTVVGRGGFRGNLSMNESSVEVPVSGQAEAAAGRARMEASIRYEDVPAEWVKRSRSETVSFRLRGEISGAGPIGWSGTLPWDDVRVVGGAGALSRFVQLGSFELTALSDQRTEGRAVLSAMNPFSFPVSVEAATYRVLVNGQEVGGGAASERALRPKKKAGVELPFSAKRPRFLAAAGERWAVGAPVDAELSGSLTVRLAGAAFAVPFRYPGRLGTDGARSGVFSHPDGGGSLSPHR